MDSSLHKPNLYRWKRHTDGRVYSRSQRLTTNNDVQDWIKKVENASNDAAEKVFGGMGRENGRYQALQTRDQIRDHDHTLSEAQELLSQWMEEKVPLNSELDDHVSDEAWYHSAIEADVKREWDHLLEDNLDPWPPRKHKAKPQDPYQDIYNMDDKDAVNMVLHNMMEKEVIKDSVLKTWGKGDDSKKPDLHMKMEMRHKQVKENREKRQAEIEQRRRTTQSKKEAQFEAKQILLKEEKEKARKMKHEEMEIQKEMARIRKQMQEEKRHADEERQRRKQERERSLELARDAEEELTQQLSEEQEERRRGEEQRREFLRKMEHLHTRQAAVNIKVLQRHFSAWYSLVLERHMKLGKAKAISDWRCLLKVWNAWKSYTRNKKLEVETQRYQSDVKETYRKQQVAEAHHRKTVLRRHLAGWRFWAVEQRERRELEQAQSNTRSKMRAFLSAAATGQLWQDQGSEGGDDNRPNSAMQKVDEMFSSANRRRAVSVSGDSSARSSVVEQAVNKPLNPRIPTEAWQVTRRHLNLKADEIAQLGGQANVDTESTEKSRKRLGKVPWNIPQMPVSAFENRHKAQQKILEQQQKQLKEQQRLIEELQFNQKNHALQQELLQQQKELQNKLDHIANSQQALKPESPSDDNSSVQKDKKSLTNGTIHQDTNKLSPPQSARSATTQCSALSRNSTAPSVSSTASKSSKHLNVLKKMEERAAERARMKEERELKRKQAEEEKMQRLAEEEAEVIRRQEDEKLARVEAYRDKKRQEKQREEERARQIERFRELNVRADQHYLRSLLKYRGLLPMTRLVQRAHSQNETADKHATVSLLRKTFNAWNQHVKGVMTYKNEMADEMNQYFAVKRCFSNWKNYKNIMSVLEMRARRFYQRSLQHRVFLAWADITAQEKVAGWERERHAREHNLRRMKKKMFLVWREYPKEKKIEAEKEKRKADMRRKVASLLPDFDNTPRNSVDRL